MFACPKLAFSSRSLAWEDLNAFQSALEWKMRPVGSTPASSRSATVRLGWAGNEIYFWASLPDDDVFSAATADNQRMWQLGDVFEVFVRDAERENYIELHVTPNGHRLQLAFPTEKTTGELRAGQITFESLIQSRPLFDFLVRMSAGGWEVLGRVPLASFHPDAAALAGRTIQASFCRYDYTRGVEKPALSSTSDYREVNFHRCGEWKSFHCLPG